jgi:hypothetical protein
VATKSDAPIVNRTLLLYAPPTVTTTGPLVAPSGTERTTDVALQVVGVAVVPLNVTVLLPWVEPKFSPAIVTDVPTDPEVGVMLEMLGETVNVTVLLDRPLTVRATGPLVAPGGTGTTIDVALHAKGDALVPLKVTVLLPWVEPKLVPVIVTAVPIAAAVADKLVMAGACGTVKGVPLLLIPLAATTTLPVVAPDGTVATIDVALQLSIAAVVPLNVTELVLCVEPKFVPVIVTDVPTAPEVGDRLVMLGAVTTVKVTPLLLTPLAFTTTLPVVAPVGTVATIDVALQLVIVAVVPLNVTEPVPWVDPKPAPATVTEAPAAAEVGERLEILGVGSTANDTPLLDTPPAFTTTLPVVAPAGTVATIDVALQLVIVALVPLNVTDPCVVPKFEPPMVTETPTAPDVGNRLLTVGVCDTVKVTPLLAAPPTVTTTFPEVAPAGTGTAMLVALQLVGVPAVPLNVTVLVPWLAPKLVPVIVTDAPTTPEVGARLMMDGVRTCADVVIGSCASSSPNSVVLRILPL